jgi:hypothetical protein
MPSLLGLPAPTMTDPRVGRGKRDLQWAFGSPRRRGQLATPPAIAARNQLRERGPGRTAEREQLVLAKPAREVAGICGSRLRLFRLVSVQANKKVKNDSQTSEIIGAPNGNRTRVFAVKGRRPGPLDDGRGFVEESGSAGPARCYKVGRSRWQASAGVSDHSKDLRGNDARHPHRSARRPGSYAP